MFFLLIHVDQTLYLLQKSLKLLILITPSDSFCRMVMNFILNNTAMISSLPTFSTKWRSSVVYSRDTSFSLSLTHTRCQFRFVQDVNTLTHEGIHLKRLKYRTKTFQLFYKSAFISSIRWDTNFFSNLDTLWS